MTRKRTFVLCCVHVCGRRERERGWGIRGRWGEGGGGGERERERNARLWEKRHENEFSGPPRICHALIGSRKPEPSTLPQKTQVWVINQKWWSELFKAFIFQATITPFDPRVWRRCWLPEQQPLPCWVSMPAGDTGLGAGAHIGPSPCCCKCAASCFSS